jgi:branched-subunit amino acid transport protein
MNAWIALLVAAAATWALRAGPSLVGADVVLPGVLTRANRLVGPAVLTALATRTTASVVTGGGAAPALVAVLLAGPVAWRTRSIGATLVCGLAVYLAVSGLTG